VALGAAIIMIAAPSAIASGEVTPNRVITVSSISALQSAADSALPGDRIELTDGSYTTSGSITLRRSGTASAPITIAAQRIGGAEIRGSSGFAFSNADFVVVEGFRFTHSGTITIPGGSEHVRFTRNVVQLSGGTNWVTVTADDAEVDHNTFQNKSSQGVFLQIAGPGSNDMAARTWIHHNYFFNHTFGGDNGGESIRLGLSFRQQGSARAIVEHNLFERTDGDSEAISVKSSDNIVRHNTLRNSRGSIVLRHGNRNTVDGNLMLGNTAGIRFYDNDHVIINNVIQGGTGQIIAGSGTVADDTNTTAHARPDRVLVAFNTVVANRTALLQVGQGTDRLGPNQCTFANNIFVGGGSGGLIDIDESTAAVWQGNIVFAGTGGNAPTSGFRVVNPALVTDAGGLRRLALGSPAIDSATGSFPQAARDMDLDSRSGTKDVGADEFVAGGTQRRPLTTADVGPNAGGSTPPPVNRFEAENAAIFHGVVEANHAGFTGTGFVNNDNEIGSYVEWTVSSSSAQNGLAVFRFANGTTANRPVDITVNGTLVADEFAFQSTGAWTTWQTRSISVPLNAGTNTIRLTGTTANGGPNLDHLEIG
jgi:parallel beta-helix repeat protein